MDVVSVRLDGVRIEHALAEEIAALLRLYAVALDKGQSKLLRGQVVPTPKGIHIDLEITDPRRRIA